MSIKPSNNLIDTQAQLLLNYLHLESEGNNDNDNIITESFAFYNGRERWAGISVWNPGRDALYIIFGEHRNSDQLVVQTWKGPSSLNPPTINTTPEESYEKRKFFPYMDLVNAKEYIEGLIEDYIQG